MTNVSNPLRGAARGLLALAIGLALVTPPTASADGLKIWEECINDGAVKSGHSQEEFRDALADPPADSSEYSDCVAQISAAQKKAVTGGGGAGGGSNSGGGAAPAAPERQVAPAALGQALAQSGGLKPAAPGAPAQAPAPAVVDGQRIDLASNQLPSFADTLSLPLPLAASAVVVLVSAGLPIVRYGVARFGTTTTTPTAGQAGLPPAP